MPLNTCNVPVLNHGNVHSFIHKDLNDIHESSHSNEDQTVPSLFSDSFTCLLPASIRCQLSHDNKTAKKQFHLYNKIMVLFLKQISHVRNDRIQTEILTDQMGV